MRIRRVLRAAVHGVLPRGMRRVVVRGGIRYQLTRRGAIDRRLLKDGHWEPESILRFFNGARNRNARIFLDIGANIGYYSLLAARLGIFEEIHAIEPRAQHYRRLLWHINANNFGAAITTHNTAASAHARAMKITESERVVDAAGGEGEVITAKTLDEMFAYRGRDICIKMDVEGHEEEVICGARRLLAENNVFMQMEILGENTEYACRLLAQGFALTDRTGDEFYFTRNAPATKPPAES